MTGPGNYQVAGKYPFLHQRCVICLRAIVPSELSESLSYRWRVSHHWSKGSTNCRAIVNPQAEEFSFHRCKNHSTKKLLNLYSMYGHKNHCGSCFQIRQRAYFVFKNAHASLRDRQRVNTCQMKGSPVWCWLDVVWVWREWLGLIKKHLLETQVLRLGLKRLQSFSNEGTRTSLGVQRSWRPRDYASGLSMQEEPLQRLVIESISCIQCSTGKIYQRQIPLWPMSVRCTVVRKWSQEICGTQRESAAWD